MKAPTAALELALFILHHAAQFTWTVRGSGRTLRLDLSDSTCLHIWCPSRAIDGVSLRHDHPWNMISIVLLGRLVNHTFRATKTGTHTHYVRGIECGMQGSLLGDEETCRLKPTGNRLVEAGQEYRERFDVIHESNPVEGTVTLVNRSFVEGYVPRVFWPIGTARQHVQPRYATPEEVKDFVEAALRLHGVSL